MGAHQLAPYEISPTLLIFDSLTASQHFFVAAIIVLLLLVILCPSRLQKQNRHQRDRSLDLYIATKYKKMFFAMVKSTFKRNPPQGQKRKPSLIYTLLNISGPLFCQFSFQYTVQRVAETIVGQYVRSC